MFTQEQLAQHCVCSIVDSGYFEKMRALGQAFIVKGSHQLDERSQIYEIVPWINIFLLSLFFGKKLQCWNFILING